MKTSQLFKRTLAFLLAAVMVLGVVGCAKMPTENKVSLLPKEEQTDSTSQKLEISTENSRQELEQIVEVLGNGENTEDMTDEELNDYVEELIGGLDNKEPEKNGSEIVNLGTQAPAGQPDKSEDNREKDGNYDDNGAMTKPFDQVYPELLENGTVKYDDSTLLIKMNNGGKLTDGMKSCGVALLTALFPLEEQTWYEAKLVEGTDVTACVRGLRELDEVKLVEYNYEIKTADIDDCKECEEKWGHKKNPKHKEQWHMHHCGITDGIEVSVNKGGSSSVIVAVIDSGVDYDHEDLSQNIWVNSAEIPNNNIDDDKNGYVDDYYGVNIVAGKGNGDDDNGHGTHVAGIIAAQNNNVGVVGIAHNVKIMPIKAAMANGTLNQSDIAKAVYYAYENGAEVINMSFGGTACSIAVQDALAVAYSRCVLVASAGNDGENNEPTPVDPIAKPNYPAALTYVLGVMSVDENGVESSFSNYDVYAFNGIEYELYAPGEAIMSTLPNDQYGILSGTSMAAPTVSAIAAILRSEFSDRDMYPTKFIYGQLCCTSDYHATCLDPKTHGKHDIPQVVNLYAALTELPNPELGVQDYALFDTVGLANDNAGANNGDGVIDAGETFALGLTLRNRWGMSEDTVVTVDANNNGIADPYIKFINPTVNYGSVGTYSTQDCGKIFTDELLTAWENPFYVYITPDCPNDYRFTIYVTITCKNALDPDDDTLYEFTAEIDLTVRSGKVLPSVIEEDMVLTADNLYIIPNATVINEGVTVRVEPGTHIQFWSDDANDPYASDYIAYLLVNGRFLVEGTKENPVYIYPSDLMSNFNIEMAESVSGCISLKYADVTNLVNINSGNTNLYNSISLADHCTFRFNNSKIYYRRVLSGKVYTNNTSSSLPCYLADFGMVKDSVFYKIGIEKYSVRIKGNAERCIFVECGIDYSYDTHILQTKDCVFLKNSFVDQTNPDTYVNSTYTAQNLSILGLTNSDILEIAYRPETGTTYLAVRGKEINEFYLNQLGGGYAVIETEEEAQWVRSTIGKIGSGFDFNCGTRYDKLLKKQVWSDGSEISTFLDPDGVALTTNTITYYNFEKFRVYDTSNTLYEIPGDILPTEIRFNEYEVTMDTETTYQIAPLTAPVQLGLDRFIFESSDESVLTVDENGIVSPVGLGKADVYVYYKDRAVYNYITIEVKEKVELDNINLAFDTTEVAVGETVAAKVTFTPENTTRRNVKFASDNENVAIVDAAGSIYGIGAGTATITATCEGKTATVDVTVYVKTTSLEFNSPAMQIALTDTEKELPTLITNEGAEPDVVWRSTDTEVIAIENGKLIPKKEGTSTIEAKDLRTGLTATCLVIVSEKGISPIKDMFVDDATHIFLLENGELYYWRENYSGVISEVELFSCCVGAGNENFLVLKKDGTLEERSFSGTVYKTFDFFKDKKVVDLGYGQNHRYFVVTDDGRAYSWGSGDACLGQGTTANIAEPKLLPIEDVVEICVYGYTTSYFLAANGDVYYAGGTSSYSTSVPVKIAEGIVELFDNYAAQSHIYAKNTQGQLCLINTSGNHSTSTLYKDMDDLWGNANGSIGLCDGKVYTNVFSSSIKQIPGIYNAVDVYSDGVFYYVITEDGMLYGFGTNNTYNHLNGVTSAATVENPTLIPLAPLAEENVVVSETNLSEEKVLSDGKLILTLNKQAESAEVELYADGEQIVANALVERVNDLVITRSGFEEGVEYTLIIRAGKLHAAAGVTNAEDITVTFTYKAPEASEDTENEGNEENEETVIHESVLDTTIQRIYTAESLVAKLKALVNELQINPGFYGNAILNPISTDTEVTHWLRPIAPTVSAGTYQEIPFGGNYWGTTNEKAIGLQMTDYTDFITYGRLMYAPYLTEAPENTFPFVTSVSLINKAGETVTTVGNEEVTFRVTFNRDMDTAIPLRFTFGSAYPYADYVVEGSYVDARTWEGKYTLNTLIENGNQFVSIGNGCSATDDLTLQTDNARFGFVIDTTAAQALIMQGSAEDTGIKLWWTQDDFDTLMGYNVYRSTALNGYYQRLNSTVIPFDTMEFFDDTVEPGVVYYYNFTVVKTDLTESTPSGKITIMSKDTMAPNIYHSPVYFATMGQNLIVTAEVTDNLSISYANLYYRSAGETAWKTVRMNNLNDKYSAIIPASSITLEGLEYYIEAFDGVSFTYRGSETEPYAVTVKEALDVASLGDVDGDGIVSNRDALILLQAISHKYNMNEDEFKRADLNADGLLSAVEALRILHYVTGKVGTLDMTA